MTTSTGAFSTPIGENEMPPGVADNFDPEASRQEAAIITLVDANPNIMAVSVSPTDPRDRVLYIKDGDTLPAQLITEFADAGAIVEVQTVPLSWAGIHAVEDVAVEWMRRIDDPYVCVSVVVDVTSQVPITMIFVGDVPSAAALTASFGDSARFVAVLSVDSSPEQATFEARSG